MNIVLVSPYDFATPGGVTEHVTHLDRTLRQAGHRTTIIAPLSRRHGIAPPPHLVAAGEAIAVPTNGSVARISLALRLAPVVRRLLAEGCPEIIHLHEPFMPLLPFIVLRHARCPIVATFHAYSRNELGYQYGRRLVGHFFKSIDRRIAVSGAARSFVERYFPGDYTIIPNGVEVERFQRAVGYADLRDDNINILFVGRLEERKGFNFLLQAFVQLRRRGRPIRLIVVGPYDSRLADHYRARLATAGISDVLFAGYATASRLARYYGSCDVVCAPSVGGESFGMVLLEGMAAGKAIVASRIPGYREVVDDGVEGLLVPPGDVSALVSALDALISDRGLRESLGRRGSAKVERYAWPLIGARIVAQYESTLNCVADGSNGGELLPRMKSSPLLTQR